MSAELLEAGQAFGSILGVWFALVGWKLVPALRARLSGSTDASAEKSAGGLDHW
jgi:hypothetical protein